MGILQDKEATILIPLRNMSTTSQAEDTKDSKGKQCRKYLRDDVAEK
jgi:hypothetical protein